MEWIISHIGMKDRELTIEELRAEYPELVAYDSSGFPVDLNAALPEDEFHRVLFWATEEESVDDDGAHAIAEAIPTETCRGCQGKFAVGDMMDGLCYWCM